MNKTVKNNSKRVYHFGKTTLKPGETGSVAITSDKFLEGLINNKELEVLSGVPVKKTDPVPDKPVTETETEKSKDFDIKLEQPKPKRRRRRTSKKDN